MCLMKRFILLLRYCKRIIERLFRVRIHGYPSTIIQIIPDKHGGRAWFSYEATLRTIIEQYQIDLILDVGANKGQFALETRKFYKGSIISFEPVLNTFNILQSTASHDSSWFVYNYALGNKSEEDYINIHENDKLSSFLEINREYSDVVRDKGKTQTKELIKIRRFDDIVEEMPVNVYARKILLKLDTQGYDLEVYKGTERIRDSILAIQSEVYHVPIYSQAPNWIEIIDKYRKDGYRFVGLYPLIRRGLFSISSDCLMVK